MTKPKTEILVVRTAYTELSTVGLLIVNGDKWGFTLEDRIRPEGVKIHGNTCIPAGRYKIDFRYSPAFKRYMLWLKDVKGFEFIYFHGGNTHTDTLGCILAARERKTFDFILGSLEKKLFDYVKAKGGEAFATIINGPGHEKFTGL